MKIKRLEEIYEKMVAKVESILENTEDLEEVARCGRIMKDIINMRVKVEENMDIFKEKIEDDSETMPVIRTVYDIAIVEDILQRARERFKDELYLIEHHQNSIETIRKVNEFVDKYIEKKKAMNGENFTDASIWSDSPLPEDEEYAGFFKEKLAEETDE